MNIRPNDPVDCSRRLGETAERPYNIAAAGLSSPGHFLVRIGLRDSETLVDPFDGGAAFERERFRAPPKTRGAGREVEQALQSVTDAEVLLRLQNSLEVRALQQDDSGRVIEVTQEEGALSVAHRAYKKMPGVDEIGHRVPQRSSSRPATAKTAS
jgi:regulator of sirC expression with transglutaminase-like and TPR domain